MARRRRFGGLRTWDSVEERAHEGPVAFLVEADGGICRGTGRWLRSVGTPEVAPVGRRGRRCRSRRRRRVRFGATSARRCGLLCGATARRFRGSSRGTYGLRSRDARLSTEKSAGNAHCAREPAWDGSLPCTSFRGRAPRRLGFRGSDSRARERSRASGRRETRRHRERDSSDKDRSKVPTEHTSKLARRPAKGTFLGIGLAPSHPDGSGTSRTGSRRIPRRPD